MELSAALLFYLASLYFVYLQTDALFVRFKTQSEQLEEYDEKLSGFIREILENFRDQMPDGIAGIGIPPVDPLVIPNFDQNIEEKVTQLDLRMRHINITGISKFQIQSLKADLEKGFANFSIFLPQLRADGICYMNGRILGIFPVSGDGPFGIQVKDVKINGYGDLNVTSGDTTRLHMNDLKLSFTFGPLELEFDSLMGGSRWAQTLINMITRIGPNLFLHFQEEAMEKLDEALLKLINNELDKGTLSELLNQINMSSVPKTSFRS